jgi:hypothetical protein
MPDDVAESWARTKLRPASSWSLRSFPGVVSSPKADALEASSQVSSTLFFAKEPEAERRVRSRCRAYESLSAGLGGSFIDKVEAIVARIENTDDAAPASSAPREASDIENVKPRIVKVARSRPAETSALRPACSASIATGSIAAAERRFQAGPEPHQPRRQLGQCALFPK